MVSTSDLENANDILNNSQTITIDKMDIIDKIAHLLMLLGNEITVKLFKVLQPKIVDKITKAMIIAKPLPKQDMLQILEEFNTIIESNQYIIDGGVEYAKNILLNAFGPSESKKILDKLLKSMGQNNYFSFLSKIKNQQLAEFIDNENAQTIAIILAHMEPSSAAEVLEHLDANQKIEVSIRMANLKDVSPNIIKNIANLLEQRLELLASNKVEIGGTRTVAEIFNKMGRSSRETIDMIEVFDSDLAKEIKENMFTFEDIMKIEAPSMVVLKNSIEDKELLAKALKNSVEELQNKFLDSMSKGEKDLFLEEMNYLGRLRLKEVEKAQNTIIETAQHLLEKELIFLEEEN